MVLNKTIVLFTILIMYISAQSNSWRTLGITGNAVFCLSPDDRGSVYAGCRAGIVKITGDALQLITNSQLAENGSLEIHRPTGNMIVTSMFGLFVSTNSGSTWSLPDQRLKFGPFPLAQFDDGKLIVATNKGNFSSVNGGLTWDSISSQNVGRIQRGFHIGRSGRIYAGTAPGLSVSDDQGLTWQVLPGIVNYTSDIIENPATGTVIVGVTYALATSSLCRIYRSIDNGVNWVITKEIAGRGIDALYADGDGNIYAGMLEAFRSTDDGITWEPFGNGLPQHVQINAFYRSGNTLYAGDLGKGIYALDLTPNAITDSHTHPLHYLLQQNFPNPFNPSTTISFRIPYGQQVNLSVYNLQGEKIAHLMDGMKEAGTHSATWNAADFPSGIYVCRLQAGIYMQSIKLTLLK